MQAALWCAGSAALGFAARGVLDARRRDARRRRGAESGDVLLAGVELGGTTSTAALAWSSDPSEVVAELTVDTTSPDETIRPLIEFLLAQQQERGKKIGALGIGSFGPVDLDSKSSTHGFITSTPKTRWRNCNLLQMLKHSFSSIPMRMDTDVNAPALAEVVYGGHGDDVDSAAYVTIGTGVGVGVVVNGVAVHGLMHPEGGHIPVQRKSGDDFIGECSYHKNAVEIESMVSASAIARRCGVETSALKDLGDDHPVWDIISFYIASLCISITYLISPHVIVLSGGVMRRRSLFPRIHRHFAELNAGYVNPGKLVHRLHQYIVPSKFGYEIGVIGTLHLARTALCE